MSFETTQLAPALIDFASAFPEIQLDVNLSGRQSDRRGLRRRGPHLELPDRAIAMANASSPDAVTKFGCGDFLLLEAAADPY